MARIVVRCVHYTCMLVLVKSTTISIGSIHIHNTLLHVCGQFTYGAVHTADFVILKLFNSVLNFLSVGCICSELSLYLLKHMCFSGKVWSRCLRGVT